MEKNWKYKPKDGDVFTNESKGLQVFVYERFGYYVVETWINHLCDDRKVTQDKELAMDYAKKLISE